MLAGLAFCEMLSQYPRSAFQGLRAGITRGGQQQLATQTLRVHLLGLDSAIFSRHHLLDLDTHRQGALVDCTPVNVHPNDPNSSRINVSLINKNKLLVLGLTEKTQSTKKNSKTNLKKNRFQNISTKKSSQILFLNKSSRFQDKKIVTNTDLIYTPTMFVALLPSFQRTLRGVKKSGAGGRNLTRRPPAENSF